MAASIEALNAAQREAVLHGETPLLVLAGAGTGKTSVITHRIANFVHERRVWPSRILAVTFTNKAAREMKERVTRLVGEDMGYVNVGTFHRQSGMLLRRYASKLGLDPNFVIYDADDQLSLIKQVMQAKQIDTQMVQPRAIRQVIERWKNANLGPKEVKPSAAAPNEQQAQEIYVAYQERLAAANAIDFSDMLRQAVTLLKTHADVLEECRARWTHILVDEYQDTNAVQYAWLKLLVTPDHSITVVGDDDQSIYRWRGADIGNILRFERDFPGAHLIRLEENYRSTNRILTAANGVISHNAARKGKTLYSQRGDGSKVIRALFASEREEAAAIGARIAHLGQEADSETTFGILYRTNAQSRPIEDALRRHQIPYVIIGGVRFYDRKEVKDALAYLRLIANPVGDLEFLRIVNTPARGIGKASVDKLTAAAQRESMSLLELAQAMGTDPSVATRTGISGKAKTSLLSLGRQMHALRASLANGESLSVLLGHMLQEVGYLSALRQIGNEEADERLGNLAELSRALEEYEGQAESPSLTGFLEEISLVSDVDGLSSNTGQVVMMTLHAAKGLEFTHVCLPGLEEGLLPHKRSLEDRAGLEEERRLCYVGITRAQKTLMVSAARVRSNYGQLQLSEVSRFWYEFPAEVVDDRVQAAPGSLQSGALESASGSDAFLAGANYIGAGAMPKAAPRPRAAGSAPVSPGDELAAGSRVGHATFGEGVVVAVDGQGASRKVTADFGTWGRKVVVSRFVSVLH